MRDGVLLRGDLYRPMAEAAYPLLLWRTIFRKDTLSRAFGPYDPAYFVRRGYAVFIQDARGLGASDGEFDRFTADGTDGYDTIEWLAAQPFCNGQIGMIGNYYAGYLQLMAAAENPPHLRAICPMQTSVSINRDCDNRGFLFASHIGWCMSRLISRLRDGRYDAQTTQVYLPRLLKAIQDYPISQLSALPLAEMPILQDTPFPILRDYFAHLVEGYDDFDLIHKEGRDMDMGAIQTPAFYLCGWYDSARTPLLDHCRAQRLKGVDSRVLIAPWKPGEAPARADHALETGEVAVDIQREMVEWFDHWLKGADAPGWPAVRYYDIAGGEAFSGEMWPADGDALGTLYLQADGALRAGPPKDDAASDMYLHDPMKPLPFLGYGRAAGQPFAAPYALYYAAPPVTLPIMINGLVRAEVYLSSDARDADVMMRLYDVAPDGSRFSVCDGATRARYRNGWQSEPLEPGEVYAVQIALGHLRFTLPAGHRLLLEISGSAFPKYDVNHGTAERPAHDAKQVLSHNRVHRESAHASRLVLPLRIRA
ncbi:MAG: CocE/NonD family hydrolase [Oscillospiraceae bacterium]|jgi:putative CocE/NonD family hydrolase|nr:CocE/NonD family hydrolase [Oscillospiraceae bacterium]